MALDIIPTPCVELRNPIRLDIGLSREPKLFLHGQLHREAVTVPASFPGNRIALHGLIAGKDVLEDARLDVMGTGAAVRRGGTLVERP